MSRLLTILVFALLALDAAMAPANAQPERMFLGDSAGAPGTLVTIPVDFRDDSPVRSFNGFVSFPTGLVTIEDFRCFNEIMK